MKQELLEIIVDFAEISIEQIKEESLLIDDLGIDSLMLIDLVVKIEKLINQKIQPNDVIKLKTVKDVFDFVEERM